MRRACSLLILLSILVFPILSFAATDPFKQTYYSYGEYDGALWYSSLGVGSEELHEYQEYGLVGWSIIGTGDNRTMQSFTPTITMDVTKIELPLVYTDNTETIQIYIYAADGTGVPTGAPLAHGTVYYNEIPYYTEARQWIDCNLTSSFTATMGTQYVIVVYMSTGNLAYWYYTESNVYDRGQAGYTTDGGVSWTLVPGSDLCFRVYGTQSSYSIAHQAQQGNIDASATNTIGQSYSGTFAQYIVSRGALFFNTSGLVTQDNVQSASLYVWVEADHSATDFELTVVDGSGLNGPLETTDYTVLRLNTDNEGSVSTNGISTTGYTEIALTDMGIISKTGFTKLGLRSSRDISQTTPTGQEYVTIYMGESIRPPILKVTYLKGSLGIPDEMKIDGVYAFASYKNPRDTLFVWQNTLRYEETPRVVPLEYFVVQLLASDNSVIGQTVVNQWNYSPLSMYLDNPTTATILPWKSECTLLLTGSSLYGTPDGFVPYRYEVQPEDWRGLSGPLLDAWCLTTSGWLEEMYGEEQGTYVTTGTAGQWAFTPNEKGGALFLEGIPYISVARPNLFITAGAYPRSGDAIAGLYAEGIYGSVWGTYWSAAFLNMASPWGLGGQWVIGIMYALLIVILGTLVRRMTGDPNVSLIIMGFAFVIGVTLGSYAMVIALVGTIAALFVFFHNFLLQRT